MDTRFHCVYLLTSLDPQCEGDYYIGYTVNPLRRLRQHNGELVNGARRTRRRGRPWKLVCCVSGFTEDHMALKFEWCWQHPQESARLKHILPVFLRGLRKLPYAVGVLHLLLRAGLFSRLELTLHVLEVGLFKEAAATALANQPMLLQPSNLSHTAVREDSSSAAQAHSGEESGLLQPLCSHALLHIEETTADEFQAKYLSHESTATSFLSSNSHLLCPYDLSVLSQTVQEEWEFTEKGAETCESPWKRSVSPLPCAQGATPCTPTPHGEDERKRPPLPPPSLRIPLRFKYYTETDFTREYQNEMALVERGWLPCTFCALPLRAPYFMRCPRAPFCGLMAHIVCLAMWVQHALEPLGVSFEHTAGPSSLPVAKLTLVPTQPCACPLCGEVLHWGALIRNLKQRAVKERRLRSHHRRLAMEQRLQTRLQRAHLVAHKRRRVAARAADVAVTEPRKANKREEAGSLCRERSFTGETSQTRSTSPPLIIAQASTRMRGYSPPIHSAFLRTARDTQSQRRGEQSMDSAEAWVADDRTLSVTHFDENEWLNY